MWLGTRVFNVALFVLNLWEPLWGAFVAEARAVWILNGLQQWERLLPRHAQFGLKCGPDHGQRFRLIAVPLTA